MLAYILMILSLALVAIQHYKPRLKRKSLHRADYKKIAALEKELDIESQLEDHQYESIPSQPNVNLEIKDIALATAPKDNCVIEFFNSEFDTVISMQLRSDWKYYKRRIEYTQPIQFTNTNYNHQMEICGYRIKERGCVLVAKKVEPKIVLWPGDEMVGMALTVYFNPDDPSKRSGYEWREENGRWILGK